MAYHIEVTTRGPAVGPQPVPLRTVVVAELRAGRRVSVDGRGLRLLDGRPRWSDDSTAAELPTTMRWGWAVQRAA